MIPTRTYVAALLAASPSLLACPPHVPTGGAKDTTPPEFLQVEVQLEAPTGPNPRGRLDIKSSDVNRSGLQSDLAIRLVATAGDAESGIASIVIQSELTWQCAFGRGSELIGVPQRAPLSFSPVTQPASPVTPVQLNAVANPIAQTGCDMSAPGKGPVNVEGFVRVVATSGAGATVTSKTFLFDYADVGVRQ